MKGNTRTGVLFILILVLYGAAAQENSRQSLSAPISGPLTFEAAWERMAAVHPSLQSLMIDRAAALRELESRASWIPGISAGAGISRNSNLISGFIDPGEDGWNEKDLWTLRGSLDLRFNIKPELPLEEQVKALQLEQAVFQTESRMRDLQTSLKKLFHQILEGEKTLEVQEQAVALTRARLEQIETQYNQGLRSDLDLLAARIAAARDLPALQKARTDQEKRLITLRDYLGLPGEAEIILLPPPAEPEAKPLPPATLEGDLENSDSVRSARIQLDLARLNRELTSRNLRGPSLGLTMDMSLGASASLGDLTDPASLGSRNLRDGLNLGISFTLPLDSRIRGSSADNTLARLDGEIEKKRLNFQEALSSARGKLKALMLDLDLSKANLEVHELNVSLQEQNYQKVQEGFETGRASLLDLDNSRQELLKARLTRDNERMNQTLLLIDLERLTGFDLLP